MNILYAVPFWPYLYTSWLYGPMKWMRDRGHKLAVLSLGDPPGPHADLRAFGLEDVPVLQLRLQYATAPRLGRDMLRLAPDVLSARSHASLMDYRRMRGVRQGLHEWTTLKRAIAFIREHRIQIIEAQWASHAAAMACDIKAATGIPFVVKLAGGDIYRAPSPNLQQIVSAASAVLPASQFLADLLLGQRPVPELPTVPKVDFDLAKLRICHHGLPNGTFVVAPPPQSTDMQVVGTIGRLDPEKRHRHLVDAVADLAHAYPGLRLHIVGGGQLHEPLTEQARNRGIADRVLITGGLPWQQVIEERRRFHIYGHAAAIEGFSLATLEGISTGLPAVATRTGAHAQMIDDGRTGHLVPIDNVTALRDRLKDLLDAGPDQRFLMAQQALELVRARFQYDHVIGYAESILEAVVRGAPLPPQPV